MEGRLKEPGAWGLMHLLRPLRLRERDDGQRFLVDLRAGGGAAFLEITSVRPKPLASAESSKASHARRCYRRNPRSCCRKSAILPRPANDFATAPFAH